jgi:hypothetical protein
MQTCNAELILMQIPQSRWNEDIPNEKWRVGLQKWRLGRSTASAFVRSLFPEPELRNADAAAGKLLPSSDGVSISSCAVSISDSARWPTIQSGSISTRPRRKRFLLQSRELAIAKIEIQTSSFWQLYLRLPMLMYWWPDNAFVVLSSRNAHLSLHELPSTFFRAESSLI